MNAARRRRAVARRRRIRSPARPTGLGLRRPAGSRPPTRQRAAQAVKKLDLTQLLTLGAVLVSLVFAIPEAINARADLEATRVQNETARDGHIADSLSRAVEQLGNQDDLEIRLGGIYAMGRIPADSERDYSAAMNVLATFVRVNTQRLRQPGGSCPETDPSPDVQAALTVLIRPHAKQPNWDIGWLDLTNTCLYRAYLYGASLHNADLRGSDLRVTQLGGASIVSSNLADADLSDADLRGSDLRDTQLARASVIHCNLLGVGFTHTELTDTKFRNTDLRSARIAEGFGTPDLTGALTQ